MKKLIIPIQSFIDVVTNSSTEIFVEATSHTKDHIIDMVNEILKADGSDKTCDDLFDIQLRGPYIEVTSKNLESSEAATYLNSLDNIFDITAEFNG